MEDLLQSQIRDSCRLALPEGLKDLMCDISREVLRAQPADVYQFITDYLGALLLTRDTLSIACNICRDVCECSCRPELDEELGYIGLEGEDLDLVKSIILKYLDSGEVQQSLQAIEKNLFAYFLNKISPVKEANIIMKLFKKTTIDEDMLLAIQEAIRRAFLRHQMDHPKKYEMPLPIEAEEAAAHTVKVYQSAEEERDKMATKIQALFRGYLVRKDKQNDLQNKKKKVMKFVDHPKLSRCSASSQSLAGSFLKLPIYVPYSAHDKPFNKNNEPKYQRSLDYSEKLSLGDVESVTDGKKKIGFLDGTPLEDIESCSKNLQEYCVEDVNGDSGNDLVEEQIVEYKSINYDEDFEEDLEDNRKESESENQRKTSFSRDLVEEINYESFPEVEEDKDFFDGIVDQDAKTEYLYDYNSFDVKSPDITSTRHDEGSHEDIDNYDITNNSDNKDSVTTLSFEHRDHSIMIKPVNEHIDLQSSIQKSLEDSVYDLKPSVTVEGNEDSHDEDRMNVDRESFDEIPEQILRMRRYTDG